MSRGRGAPIGTRSKYMHLLRAMRAGDVLFLPATADWMLERAASNIAAKYDCELTTGRHLTVRDGLETGYALRIEMLKPITASLQRRAARGD